MGLYAFERALAIDPKDELARNQIAFMLDAEGRHRSARDEFKQLLTSSDPERRLRACESYGKLRNSVNRLMPKPWFGEVYLAPEYDRPDLRGGLVVAQEWNMLPLCDQANPFAPRFIADFYGDLVYFSRYDDDVIGFARIRPGYRFFENANYATELYAMAAGATDTQNNPDNRFIEGGFGVEAGLRTYNLDLPFPEEANRRLVACIAQIHFAPTERAANALMAENIPR